MMLGLLVLSLATALEPWRPTLRQLRTFEVTLFALIIVFFMAAQYVVMLRGVRDDDPMRLAGGGQEQRAVDAGDDLHLCDLHPQHLAAGGQADRADGAGAGGRCPGSWGWLHPELYEVAIRAANLEQVSEHGLFLLLGAFTAIFGTHTINTLRIEAYKARLLNQYRLGRKLGGGGMGEVYLAEHQLLKRPCAIKLIRHDLVGQPTRLRPLRARGARDGAALALEHDRDLRLRPQRRRRVLLRDGISARPQPGRPGRAATGRCRRRG